MYEVSYWERLNFRIICSELKKKNCNALFQIPQSITSFWKDVDQGENIHIYLQPGVHVFYF